MRFDADGGYYESAANGVFPGTATGTWLTSGLSSQVWIERTITSGTLEQDGIGAGRVQLNTSRVIGVNRSVIGFKTAGATVDFYNAASGGTLLDSAFITPLSVNKTA